MTSPVAASTVVEPIRRAFPAEKSKAWHYKIHPYYTKQPSNLVGEYIRHFCPDGGLVVDPFCGTGVTAVEALTNRRRALCIDLDPLAVFITRMTCLSPVDLNAYWDAYRQIEREMKPIIDFVRKATHKELQDYEIEEWYPKAIKLPSNADREYVEDLFGKAQLISLAHLKAAILKIKFEQARCLLLFVFSGILARASITYGIDSKHAGGGDSGIFKVYRYWVPPTPDYRDIWQLFSTRAKLVANAKKRGKAAFGDFAQEGATFNVSCDSAENLLKYTPEKSVDYIYTDPPYGAHIAYLDLSTMWHAWLGFNVPNDLRQREAIVGGEQHFDEKHYLDVLGKSFEQMFYALKDEAWLSLVFHHKETNLWYNLRDTLRYIGFTYVNTVAQPLAKQTFHKVKNPLRVLGESLIVNFQKTATRKMSQPMSLPMANVIKNVAERVIYREVGATTEEVLREVVPDLFENNLFFDAASKNMGDILAILESDFELDENNLWQIKEGHEVGSFIPAKDRIKYYVSGYLQKMGKADFDSIVTTILPRLTNGHKPTKQNISDVLKEIAISHDGVNWELKGPDALAQQGELPIAFEKREPCIPEIPATTKHNQQIYRLALLCQKAGLVPYIGKQELSDHVLAGLKPLNKLNVKTSAENLKRVQQIDIIWAQSDGTPAWAFEIEEHTSILSGLERFVALLSAVPEIGKRRQLTIVAPKSRRRKLRQELTSSSYIGHPLFLENKITYMFFEDLESGFPKYCAKANFRLEDMHTLCQLPPISE